MSRTERTNEFGQPIGIALPDWTPRARPPRTILQGRFCRVEPLDGDRHADALYAAYDKAVDARDWTYLPNERATSPAAFRTIIDERAASPDPMHMAIVRNGKASGSAAFMRIDPANGVIEIGHIHLAPRLQRTAAATEALFLMMRRAFDELGYRRLEWKCDSLNGPSRHAALRLGFAFEGIFANAIVTKGRNRDTAWYAMTAEGWPARRIRFEKWLALENFDEAGVQRTRLAVTADVA